MLGSLYVKLDDLFYLKASENTFMLIQLCTVLIFFLHLLYLSCTVIKWNLNKARFQVLIYESVRSVVYAVELILMIVVFDSWHIYGNYISDMTFFYKFEGVLWYGQIIFWSWIVVYKPLTLCMRRENRYRNEAGVVDYEALVDRDLANADRIRAARQEADERLRAHQQRQFNQ